MKFLAFAAVAVVLVLAPVECLTMTAAGGGATTTCKTLAGMAVSPLAFAGALAVLLVAVGMLLDRRRETTKRTRGSNPDSLGTSGDD